MTYSPGSSGYPPAQPPGSYGTPAQSFGPAAAPGPSKLPFYLTIAVVVLGLAAYLFSFGPMFTLSSEIGPFAGELSAGGSGLPIVAVLLAALLAAVGLLPKAFNYTAVVAVISTVAALLVIAELISKPSGFEVGWALWAVLACAVLQAIAAITALLLDSGVITPPAPRPKYEQPQYGQYGPPAGYYSQPSQPVPGPGPRPGYPTPYGGYSQGPSGGGYGGPGPHGGPQSGPPTPPTGYPSFSPPPAVGSGHGPSGPSSSPSGPSPQPQPQQAPSSQPPSNGPSSS